MEINVENLYLEGKSSYFIAEQIGVSPPTIIKHLKKLGIPIRGVQENSTKYSIDSAYFEKIDSNEKAYWLGFIYADGSVSDKRLKIAVSEKDKEVLEAFSKDIRFTGIIYSEKPSKGFKNCGPMSVLCIYNKNLVKQLEDLGVIINKVNRLSMPKIDIKFIPSFLLGFLDGDGYTCFCKKRKRLDAGFTSNSKEFLSEIQNYLKTLNIGSFLTKNGKSKFCYRLLCHSCNAIKLLNILYKIKPSFSLTRKFQNYKEALIELPNLFVKKRTETLSLIHEGIKNL